MTTVMDFHAWNEVNGKIYDHDMKSKELKKVYDKIALLRLGTKEYTFIHKKWKNIPEKLKDHEVKMKEALDGMDYKEIWNMVKNMFGKCFTRAIMIESKNKSAKVLCGSLGLKCNKTGKIWWEHGNGKDNY